MASATLKEAEREQGPARHAPAAGPKHSVQSGRQTRLISIVGGHALNVCVDNHFFDVVPIKNERFIPGARMGRDMC